MAFRETCRMEERVRLLSDYDSGGFSISELCRRYGISRDTFYVWAGRRASGVDDWFKDGSHAPLSCPHRTAPEIAAAIVAMRRRFGFYGPRKLKLQLERERPDLVWPAASVIGDVLKRAGLVETRRRQRRALGCGETATAAVAANQEWCVDFKGWFRTRDGRRCDPLTISDAHSRFLIAVRITPQTVEGSRRVFEAAFREHGLPQAIRSDNGSPFGSSGAGGLTRLSAWWLRLGIATHFIRPASPQENGRHERMHRTLKQQTASRPADTLAEQQERFDRFRQHYNHERPHEGLGQTPPGQHWSASPVAYPEQLPEPWYDADHQVRRVRTAGEIRWRNQFVFIGEALAGQLVGIAERDPGIHVVRFCGVDLGLIDAKGRFLRFAPLRHRAALANSQADPDRHRDLGAPPATPG